MPIKLKRANGTIFEAQYGFYNNHYINEIYYGSKLVLSSDKFRLMDSTPGTKTIHIPESAVYNIHLVGAGGGGNETFYYKDKSEYFTSCASGGSGAHVWWWQYLEAGDYTVTIGAGGACGNPAHNGGYTTFQGQVAWGGDCGYTSGNYDDNRAGAGGLCTTIYNELNGNSGSTNPDGTHIPGGASLYKGYGRGGYSDEDGVNGLIEITYASQNIPLIFAQEGSNQTYNIPLVDGVYEIVMVGGGGASAYFTNGSEYGYTATGGQAAMVKGNIEISAGTYEATIGTGGQNYGNTAWGGDGGDTTFLGNTAGHGFGAAVAGYIGEKHPGYGGEPTVADEYVGKLIGYGSTIDGQGVTTPIFENYGAGGTVGGYWSAPGGTGYLRIRQLSGK